MTERRGTLSAIEPAPSTHAGLWLDRFLADGASPGKKQAHIEQAASVPEVGDAYKLFFRLWRHGLETLEGTVLATATVNGRMVVGLGAESVLETAVALHRTHGVPYIPGSALKGLAAAAAHRMLEEPAWRRGVGDAPAGESHRLLFGDTEGSGVVVFHDALWWPEGSRLPLDLDVMTVHHPFYYQGRLEDGEIVPPADWDSPNPVAFATAHGKYLVALTGPAAWVKAALAILGEALRLDGVGAKTAAGYGRMTMEVLSPPDAPGSRRPSAAAEPDAAGAARERRVRELHFGNAPQFVPKLLREVSGDERARLARRIVEQLGKREVAQRAEKDWARELLAAAEDRHPASQ